MRAADLDHAKTFFVRLTRRGGWAQHDAGGVGAERKLHGLPSRQTQLLAQGLRNGDLAFASEGGKHVVTPCVSECAMFGLHCITG